MIIVGALLALRTPVADPARISVADQLSRLQVGTVTAESFDFDFLRYRAGRYGRQAPEQLAAQTEGPQAPLLAERPHRALGAQGPWGKRQDAPPTPAQPRLQS